MRVLFDINHPAQVHLFKNAIRELKERGHTVHVTSREKEMTTTLLDEYGIDHTPLSSEWNRFGPASLVGEWGIREVRMLQYARRFDPDVIVSRLNPSVVHVSTLLGCRNLIYQDTKLKPETLERVYHAVTCPFVDKICVPPDFSIPVPEEKQVSVGFQELSYLHPNWFTPDPESLREYGVDPENPYFVLRFAGWQAFHDVGNTGLSVEGKRELVSYLAEHGDVYITSEAPLPPEFEQYKLTVPPHMIHDLLYYATLYVGDSETMPTEAALLGTPAIRVNSMVGKGDISNFLTLEDYGLMFSFADEDSVFEKVEELLTESNASDWEEKRDTLLSEQGDVTASMLELVEEQAAIHQSKRRPLVSRIYDEIITRL
ncbi:MULTISPECIES: hypothetical protein [Haloferax]|uniref:hypothetical protein n=1 Tax=Haloferax TaxID=2251 RepID=UPI00177CD99A|nr:MULTISPECIES: hypothetical protein [Haloferax]